jgi:mRNA interferase MazF
MGGRRGQGEGTVTDLPRRGEVWWCETPGTGSRPVVVISRDAAIPRRRQAMVAPCTTTIRGLPSEVVLDPEEDPVPRLTAANLDAVQDVPVALLIRRMGTLGWTRMAEVCAALEAAVDCGRGASPARPGG